MKFKKIVFISAIVSVSLYANQNTPSISDALKDVQQPKIKRQAPQLPSIQTDEKDVPKEFKDGKKVKVERFIISGAKHMKNEELKAIVAPYEGKMLSFKDMQEVNSKITKVYREKGYFVARAYVPLQNIFTQDNRLKIEVIEGNYGKFHLQNDSLVDDGIIQANLDDIKDKNIISSHTLERAMLIINDTPGVIVNKAEVRPGAEIGTSDFIIGTEATAPYNGYIIADNYGSQYTGKHRIMAGVDINSPLKLGDKLSLFAMTSEETGLLSGQINYDFPLHPNGTRANLSYAKTTYELGSDYKALDAIGDSDSVSLGISYPIIRTRLETLKVYFETSYSKMSDEIQATNSKIGKETLVATAGMDYTKDWVLFDKNSQSRVGFSVTTGELGFDDSVDKQNDEAGADTNGNFTKINIELGQDFQLMPSLRFENTLQMQYALDDKNLDGSQDLSIGGINGVKFYPSGEESAENGFIFSSELIYALPAFKGLNSSISFFYDVGRVYVSNNFSGANSKTFQDFGLGYYGSYKDTFINAHLAHNIAHDVTSQDNYSSRFMVQAGWMF